MAQARNTSIAIAKGIAIILMVAGHAECPGTLMSLIYIFAKHGEVLHFSAVHSLCNFFSKYSRHKPAFSHNRQCMTCIGTDKNSFQFSSYCGNVIVYQQFAVS